MTVRRQAVLALAVVAGTLAAGFFALDGWIGATRLPPLSVPASATVLDRNGTLLRAYTVGNGIWRLPVTSGDVDQGYLEQLVAYEDRRFYRHAGVDPLALLRAAAQAVRHGRIVSGGSTLTMQVARLLEQGPTGKPAAKLRQMRVALALERRLSKAAILDLYLTLAPFGGNLEGVRAASLSYFGKEPRRLTPAEAALLVVLPQSPEARRPDRHAAAAQAARDRALARAAQAGALDPSDARAALREAVPKLRRDFPSLAPHLADSVVQASPDLAVHRLTLDAGLQAGLEELMRARVSALGAALSGAMMVADIQSGEMMAQLGSSDYLNVARRGFVDMTGALRSPGSTLKPLIYGMAFEAGLLLPETLIEDRPLRFGTYAPQNLDHRFMGAMSARKALQLSRNLPAVALLDAVGPARFTARMRHVGVAPALPVGQTPGLAMALGGLGLSLKDLVTLYTGIARGGTAVELVTQARSGPQGGKRLLGRKAAWMVADILRGAMPPRNGVAGEIAFKTGTSYGHRDAWAVGFDGAHVIGVWLGRADGASVPGILGLDTAAPLLFEAFARLGPDRAPFPLPAEDTLLLSQAELPVPLRRFDPVGAVALDRGPQITFPPDGARLDLGLATDAPEPLVVRVGAGTPPFRWLVNGVPLAVSGFDRQADWRPDGAGFVTVSIIDATGAAARAELFLE